MVQPVVEVKPELQLLTLGDGKVLEQGHVPAEEGRSVDGRQDGPAVLANLARRGKAIPVDPLMRSQVRSWTASQDRVELNIRRAQQRGVADRDTLGVLSRDAARNDRVVEVHAKVLVLEARQVRTALRLQDAGDLPTVNEAARPLVDIVGCRQLNRVNGIEEMLAIIGLHAIVAVY